MMRGTVIMERVSLELPSDVSGNGDWNNKNGNRFVTATF